MVYTSILVALMLLLGGEAVVAQSSRGLSFFGEASTDAVLAIPDPFQADGVGQGLYLGFSTFRLDGRGGDGEFTKVESSLKLKLLYGDATDSLISATSQAAGDAAAGLGNLALLESLGSEAILVPELTKLFVSIYFDTADLSLGRMIVNYGRGTVFSPVDLFSTLDIGDIALGRQGTDAIRLTIPLGLLSGLDMVATLADKPQDATGGARFFGNLTGWDLGFSGFRDGSSEGEEGSLVLGFDMKGDLELGLSTEAVARLPWGKTGLEAAESSYSIMAGVDYSLLGNWFLDLEYLANFGNEPYSGMFRGTHNLFASISWKADELTALDGRVILNLEDQAYLGILTFSRSLVPRANLIAYLQYQEGVVQGSSNTTQEAAAALPTDTLSIGLRLSVAF